MKQTFIKGNMVVPPWNGQRQSQLGASFRFMSAEWHKLYAGIKYGRQVAVAGRRGSINSGDATSQKQNI